MLLLVADQLDSQGTDLLDSQGQRILFREPKALYADMATEFSDRFLYLPFHIIRCAIICCQFCAWSVVGSLENDIPGALLFYIDRMIPRRACHPPPLWQASQ
jgi:hypothetical protein